eukprot:362186-Chlamydomonas_euryale.AAC.1
MEGFFSREVLFKGAALRRIFPREEGFKEFFFKGGVALNDLSAQLVTKPVLGGGRGAMALLNGSGTKGRDRGASERAARRVSACRVCGAAWGCGTSWGYLRTRHGLAGCVGRLVR